MYNEEYKFKADYMFDKMKKQEAKIKNAEIHDAESLAEYFKNYTTLIYDYKWIGSIYDIYADDVVVHRESGYLIEGAHNVMTDALTFTSAFPDLKVNFVDTFAVQYGDVYKLWRLYNLDGTNLGVSKYGPPTGKSLEGDKALVVSMSTVKLINNKWRIVNEYTMYSEEWIREVCSL
ncbi:nuclear transport factor 2 family protein [Alkalibacter mobilis]|uniref:hypothetical protein n=1 Tax=Alkalibacter mobilis TaxID=2787712 RepID=UPI00189F065D|nr:hypothetical protein [Alkalibacter mobilis]MBF7096747.1 hypothetical protein [Alkalibacter mobilis]